MDALRGRELQKLGEFLNLNWKLKKSISPLISNSKIEMMIEKGRASGAYGSKLLGAGGSGYVVYFVDVISEFLDKMGAKDSGIRITGEKLQVMEI
jgi:galactokinase/mevalonate kinase-like predicted kinase